MTVVLALIAIPLSIGCWIPGPFAGIPELGLLALAVVVVSRLFRHDSEGLIPFAAPIVLVMAYVILAELVLYVMEVKLTRFSIVAALDAGFLLCGLAAGLRRSGTSQAFEARLEPLPAVPDTEDRDLPPVATGAAETVDEKTIEPRPLITEGDKPRVVYWNNQPSPYFVDRVNQVTREGRVEVAAWFDVRKEPDRSWEVDEEGWRFPADYLSEIDIFGRSLLLPHEQLQEQGPDLLVLSLDRFNHVLGSALALRNDSRIAVRYLPTFDTWSHRTWWGEMAKHFVYRAIDGAKVSGPAAMRQLRHYGMPAERMVTVTQGIDVEAYKAVSRISEEQRAARRSAEGLAGTVFIYVGRMWDGKGIPTLLDAFRRVIDERPARATLVLVGDGADEAKYRMTVADLPDVRFYGFVPTKEVPSWYALADVMVFPTLGDPHGLVVEEAMAAGLPVIVTTNAGDIERRVHHGKDGLIVTAGSVDSLQAAMRQCVDNPAMVADMKEAVRTQFAPPTLQRYAEDFERFVSTMLDLPPRQTWERRALLLLSRGAWTWISASRHLGRLKPLLTRDTRSNSDRVLK